MTSPNLSIAVLPIRSGVPPVGAAEAVSSANGFAFAIGTSVNNSIDDISPWACDLILAEVKSFAPAAWAQALVPHLSQSSRIVLPASPDGRDLAPRLSAELGWPLVAGAISIESDRVEVARHGGLVLETVELAGPAVITVVPGASQPRLLGGPVNVSRLNLKTHPSDRLDTESIEVAEADAQSLDLSEAKRIMAGGAGLETESAFAELAQAAAAIDASVGGTRVVMDKGWIPFDRQIGTTGIMVNPDLYISLGISGAVQHTAGLGEPTHIIAVNTDPHCPMMAMADLALVTDAPLFLSAFRSLAEKL